MCVFPSLQHEEDFRVHVYVSETKSERKVMEEVISRAYARRGKEKNGEEDEAEEDRRAFQEEFDGLVQPKRRKATREARRVASANARWGAKKAENVTIPLG